MQYIQNFLGFDTIILSAEVPQGTIATTVADNINYFYAPISSVGQLFNMTSDETGLIGVTHDAVNNNLSYETVVTMANVLTTERLDGIVLSTISGAKSAGK